MTTLFHGFIGAIVWILVDIVVYKDPLDNTGKKFSFKKMWGNRWDNWLAAIGGGLLVAYAYGILILAANYFFHAGIQDIPAKLTTAAELIFGFSGSQILSKLKDKFFG